MKIIKSAIALTLALSALSQATPVLAWEDEEVLEPGESGFEDTQEYEEAADSDEEGKTDPEDNEEEDLLLTSTPEDMSADNDPEDSLDPKPAEDIGSDDTGGIDADTESRLLSLNQIRSLKERLSQGYEDLSFPNLARANGSEEDTEDFLTEANFPDINFRRILREMVGKESSEPVTRKELEGIDSLNTDFSTVHNLRGINYLTGLSYLDIDNVISLSDVQISGLPNLTNVYIHGNNLSSLSIENCQKLHLVRCDYTGLKTLSITDCPEITYLSCSGNAIEVLDLSSLSKLEQVTCSSNKISKFDLRQSAQTITKIYCQGNNLTDLDFHGFENLSELEAQNNQLSSLNLSGCLSLAILNVSGQHPTSGQNVDFNLNLDDCNVLGYLNCSKANLTELNFPNCSYLTELYCESNRLANLNLKSFPKLTALFCRDNKLTSLDLTGNPNLDADRTSTSPQNWYIDPNTDSANISEVDPEAILANVQNVQPSLTQYNEQTGIFTNVVSTGKYDFHSSYEYICDPDRNLTMKVVFMAEDKPVDPKNISNCRIAFRQSHYVYTGDPIKPKPDVYMGEQLLKEDADYTLDYSNNIEAGEALILIKGTGSYTGSKFVPFYIMKPGTIPGEPVVPKTSISNATVTGIKEVYPYGTDVKDIEPVVTLNGKTLKKDQDYRLSYMNSTTGDYGVVIEGVGGYTGSITKRFKIAPKPEQTKSIASARVYGVFASYEYTGYQIKPEPIVTLGSTVLKKGRDYTLSYSSNRYPGTATITIKGTGNYSGTIKETFRIVDSSDDDSYSYSDRGTVSMFRLYNPNSGEQFYTGDVAEALNTVDHGWTFEGIAWNAPKKSNTPIYRLYNRNAGDHFYTASQSERNRLKALGWKYEGIGWYAEDSNKVPVYREYNPNAIAGAHNYTTDRTEHNYLIRHGWKDEGIAWYAAK